MKKKLKDNLKILMGIITIVILIYYFCKGDVYSSMKKIFSSPQEFKKFVIGQGEWAPIIFLLIQIAQVIIAPIPGNLTSLAGGALFGGVTACFISSIAIIIGSIIAFYLARILGKPFVIKLIGEPTFNKYNKVFLDKGTITLFILFLLPFFPDDALCFLAGLSKLPFKIFFVYTAIGRLPNTIFASLAGAGIVNFTITGWIIIGILSLIAIYVSIHYGKNIENWMYSKIDLDKNALK